MEQKKQIPWIFKDSPMLKSWSWTTEHFDAKILVAMGMNTPTWKVVDTSGSSPTTLGLGEELNFPQAQDAILELIGKAYPTKCGYGAYAGDLATTFTIKNGQKVDFASYVGSNVIIEAYNKQEPSRNSILVGGLSVSHFNIELKTDRDRILVVPPAFIISVKKEFENSEMIERVEKKGAQRLFREEWRPGCTGSPGFISGTLIHNPNDIFCPIHDK
jgi:hypothetical protein